ncbi:MAG: phosphatidate cytidylyltransferase, partial [Chloroflexota bacterium]
MLWKRIASAAVLIPIVAAAVYLGGLWLSALVLAAACLATYEYLRLTDARRLDYFFGLAWVVALAADGRGPSLGLLPWCLALGLIASLTAEVFRHNAPDSLRHWALTTAGSLYIGFLASHFARLRQLPQGTEWLVLALLGTWVCDSAAYFVGTAWGRRCFFPAISPKKSWEGALGGLAGGVLAVILLGRWLVSLSWA